MCSLACSTWQDVTGASRFDKSQQVLPAGAVIMAVGINGLKRIVQGSSVLSQRPEFQRLSNLRSVDILAGLSNPVRPCSIL